MTPQQGLGPQVEHCCAGADYVCFFLLDKVNVSQCLATVVQGYPQGFKLCSFRVFTEVKFSVTKSCIESTAGEEVYKLPFERQEEVRRQTTLSGLVCLEFTEKTAPCHSAN